MTPLRVLGRFARGGARTSSAPDETTRCELCAKEVGEPHRHVVDLADRRLLCACAACAVLFSENAPGGRYRAVPDGVRADVDGSITGADLQGLGVPTELAFFFRPSKLGRWTAILPGPAGATEAELPEGAWEKLEAKSELVRSIRDDVEALLVRRRRTGRCTAFVVPIDVCYELTAIIRRAWEGIDGGEEAREALDAFFERLSARCTPRPLDVRFERASKIADAVLLEGYVLYPYRPSSTKNRYRWTFGVLAPRSWSEAGGCEPWWLEAQVLVDAPRPLVRGRLRFLRVARGEHDGDRPWERGEIHTVDFTSRDSTTPFSAENAGGSPIVGAIHVRSEDVGEPPRRLARITVRVENLTPHADVSAPRADVMRASLVSTHLLLSSDDGDFVSLLAPPPYAAEAAAACKSVGTHPVLASDVGSADLVLSAPIILYDHPRIAPESPGDFCDATEIDELLALRTMTLTPEEKALARATDSHAAAIVDRVEAMSDDDLARLHGTVRERRHSSGFTPGDRVRLLPSARRTDAQDLLYVGATATIHEILDDVDGRQYLAVTIDDDPASELHRWYGRFRHYYPDEVERL